MAQKFSGRVTFVSPDPERPFGFIGGENGETIFFHNANYRPFYMTSHGFISFDTTNTIAPRDQPQVGDAVIYERCSFKERWSVVRWTFKKPWDDAVKAFNREHPFRLVIEATSDVRRVFWEGWDVEELSRRFPRYSRGDISGMRFSFEPSHQDIDAWRESNPEMTLSDLEYVLLYGTPRIAWFEQQMNDVWCRCPDPRPVVATR